MIEDVLADIRQNTVVLPTLSVQQVKVLNLIGNSDSTLDQIVDAIRPIQSLSARLITMSNSPIFNSGRIVNDVKGAAKKVGINLIGKLVLGVSVRDKFCSKNQHFNELLHEVWTHSVSIAIKSYITAKTLKLGNPDDAFLFGILHDIGYLPIIHFYDLNDITEIEEDVLQQGIGIIGKQLLDKWGIVHRDCTFVHYKPDPDRRLLVDILSTLHRSLDDPTKSKFNLTRKELEELLEGYAPEIKEFEKLLF